MLAAAVRPGARRSARSMPILRSLHSVTHSCRCRGLAVVARHRSFFSASCLDWCASLWLSRLRAPHPAAPSFWRHQLARSVCLLQRTDSTGMESRHGDARASQLLKRVLPWDAAWVTGVAVVSASPVSCALRVSSRLRSSLRRFLLPALPLFESARLRPAHSAVLISVFVRVAWCCNVSTAGAGCVPFSSTLPSSSPSLSPRATRLLTCRFACLPLHCASACAFLFFRVPLLFFQSCRSCATYLRSRLSSCRSGSQRSMCVWILP